MHEGVLLDQPYTTAALAGWRWVVMSTLNFGIICKPSLGFLPSFILITSVPYLIYILALPYLQIKSGFL